MNENAQPPHCPYCGSKAQLADSSLIYGRSYGPVWVCQGYPFCDAYVGCHRGSTAPLGTLANAQLRAARNVAHRHFDRLWKDGGPMKRNEAYAWLAERLELPKNKTHIAMFSIEQCQEVVEVCTTAA